MQRVHLVWPPFTDTVSRATFNNITYIGQKVPSLATALTVGQDASDPRVYGVNANPFVLQSGKIIEVIINNLDGGAHPIRAYPAPHNSPHLLTPPQTCTVT